MQKILKHLCFSAIILLSLAFDGGSAEEHYNKGMESLNNKNYIQAIGEFTSAISLNEEYAEAYYQRAIAKDLLGKQEGFFSSDLCYDLIKSAQLGYIDALGMLRTHSNKQCHNAETMLVETENVFCADLSSHVLFKMPDYSDQYPYIAYLNLFDNRFNSMPDGLLNYRYLVHLDMSSNQLTDIHSEINRLPWLMELNLNKNEITAVPESLSKLKHLKQLYLRHNKLTDLPSNLSNLQQLEELDLGLNQFKSIPSSIKGMKQLKRLVLVGNPIPPSEVETLKSALPDTEIYF